MARNKFIIGGVVIAIAIGWLIFSSTQATAQYFLTIDELKAQSSTSVGRNLRISGAVVGSTIEYDQKTLTLSFLAANIPGDNKEIEAGGGLAKILHEAVIDPNRTRIKVVYHGPKPDLLRDEAQAILTGQLKDDGVFYAEEVLLKCPTKYEEAVPGQVEKE